MQVSADGIQKRKIISATQQTKNYLYVAITKKMYSVNDFLMVAFNTINGPSKGHIYYMVRNTTN